MAGPDGSIASKADVAALRARVGNQLRLELLPRDDMSLTFKIFLIAGAMPPYSAFLIAVLWYYGIRLANLSPHSIITLSVFAYLCDQFLGEPPSLDLFRWYYKCRAHHVSNPSRPWHEAIGTCHFQLRAAERSTAGTEFVHMPPRRGNFCQWKDEWVFVEDGSGLEETAVPAVAALPVSMESWQKRPGDTHALANLRARIADLQRNGLTGAMVIADAIMHRLAPLRDGMRIFPRDTNGVPVLDVKLKEASPNWPPSILVVVPVSGDQDGETFIWYTSV